MLAYNRQGVFTGKNNGIYNTGVSAFSALDTFFFIENHTPALSVRQGARWASYGAGPFIGASQTMDRKEVAAHAAQRTYFNGAFGIRVTFMVHCGADTLACKAAKTFIHMIRF
jgi:hypothetical protein